MSGIKCTSYAAGACATSAIASPGNNPGSASAAGTAFIPAGQAFSATVTAVNSAGSTTPNYGRETTPQSVNLSHTLVQPAGGSAGLFSAVIPGWGASGEMGSTPVSKEITA